MTTTLSEGVKVPDVGSVNWAGDLEVNWNLLNGALANLSGNVKTDRDNTWTGEQSFTLPIVGSITGTASKAIADEDGTSIKTGYVNVAGNQTVSGNKTWSGINTFNQSVIIAGQSGILWDHKSYTAGTLPTSTMYYGFQNAYESGGSVFDRIRSYVSTTGTNLSEHVKYAWSDLTKYASVTFWVSADGSDSEYKYNTSRVIPATNNAVTLGSSSYQWSSVYAQSYYYNGTAWGLDKANTWSNINNFQREITLAGDRNAYIAPMWAGSVSGLCLLTGDASKPVYLGNYVASGDHYTYDSSKGYLRIRVGEISTINTVTIEPFGSNTQLGTSTNKWKTLNGVNPGALSLPDIAQYIDLTANIPSASLDGNTDINLSSYITSSGWLSIVIPDTNTDDFVFVQTGTNLSNRFFMSGAKGNGFISLMMPINRVGGVNAQIKASSVSFCRFYPCLGNV